MAEKITLRDGTETTDRRLDRLQQFDERSRQFPVREILPDGFRSKTWRLKDRLDQGPDGACAGFGTTHRIAALPISFGGATYDYAFKIYKRAQQLDPWEGENYSGTSVLAAVKAAQELGHFGEYRWCFGIDDYVRAVAHEGPVIVGSDWYTGMFEPDEKGLIHPTGAVAGGHCYILRGVTLDPRGVRKGVGPVFRITNSWGPGWGENGEAYITVDEFEKLLDGGEGAVPVEKRVSRPRSQGSEHEQSREGRWPWSPVGPSTYDRFVGLPWRYKGPAGRFNRGGFSLGR
jgi:hypothetical protein